MEGSFKQQDLPKSTLERSHTLVLPGTQEEAAEAYDIAAIKFRGVNAVTNFDMSRYDIAKICSSNNVPINALAKRIKDETSELSVAGHCHDEDSLTIQTEAATSYANAIVRSGQEWQLLGYPPQPNVGHQSFQQRVWGKQEQEKAHEFSLQPCQQKFMQNGLPPVASHLQMHNLMSLQDGSSIDMNGNACAGGIFGNLSSNGLLLNNAATLPSGINLADTQRLAMNEVDDQGGSKTSAYEHLMPGDNFARNIFYLQHQPAAGLLKSNCNNDAYGNWMTPVPALSARPNLTVCHAPIFATWNET